MTEWPGWDAERAAQPGARQVMALADGELVFYAQFLAEAEQQAWFTQLRDELAWHQAQLRFYGRVVDVPRLQAWYGEPDTLYRYSGLSLTPLPWTASLCALKQAVEMACHASFNSMLANYYRDQHDSVSWHADDEPELGRNPVIASLSLGQTRDFHLKHKYRKELETVRLALPGGSLLIMQGATQHHWKHQLPKRRGALGGRINLTFRYVYPSAQ